MFWCNYANERGVVWLRVRIKFGGGSIPSTLLILKSNQMKTTVKSAVNTAKVSRKATSTKVTRIVSADQKSRKVVTYLAEGVSGKDMMNSIFASNKAHKKDALTFSFCLKRAKEFGAETFSLIKGFDEKELTPKNLIPLRSEKNISKETFSVYEVYMLIKKFYATKK